MTGPQPSDRVRVEGLRDFQRELRALDNKLPRQMRVANLEAAEVVAKEARAKAIAQGGVAEKTAPSIKAAAEQVRSKVNIGGTRYPFALGAEFGAKVYPQFKRWRGNQHQPDVDNGVGYFLYPAIRETRSEFIDTYAKALDQLMRRAFPDGRVA